jgi:cobalt/nickel transport system permease protein
MNLPAWMTTEKRAIPELPSITRRTRRRHSASAVFLEVARRELVAEESALRPGFLQRLDPRAKLICVVVLIVTASVSSSVLALGVSLAAALAVGLSSRIKPWVLLGMLMPPLVLTTAIAAPAMLSVLTPGKPLIEFITLGPGTTILGWKVPESISVTTPGALLAARLILRSCSCACWLATLVLTTRWAALLSAVGSLGAPRVFRMTLMMMYRYLFTLIRHAEDMRMAKESRTISQEHVIQGDKLVAARMGNLFQTARRLGDQVYFAMAARGFSGRTTSLGPPRPRGADVATVITACCIAAGLTLLDRMTRGS